MSKVRETVDFWNAQDKGFWRYNRRPLRHFVKFARRFAGDKHDLPAYSTSQSSGDGPDGERDAPAFGNLTSLMARIMRGTLLWRNPRFLVKPPGNYNRAIFTPLLARIETVMLNDFAEETGLYLKQRMSLIDGILGPYMVGKVTFDFDLAVDETVLLKGREEAALEDQKFVLTGIGPKVKDDDYHPSHIEQHETTIARMERGEIPAPDSAIRYLKKHVQKHREAIPYCRTAETLRNQSVHFRRINPLLYGYDIFEPDRPSWHRETFLARREDLAANPDFSRKALKELMPIRQMYGTGDNMPMMPMQYDVETPDEMVRCHEYVDLVDETVVLIADGGTVPLHIRPYTGVRIQPSGPYVISKFMEHPLHNTGIAMPYLTEAHEDAAAQLGGINTQTVLRSLPIWWVNGRAITAEQKKKIEQGDIGEGVVLDQMPDKTSGSDHIGNIPALAVPEQNVGMESYHRSMFEQHYGGSAGLGGGDHSDTATASEVTQLTRSIQADEMGSVNDDHMRRIGVAAQRYNRKFKTKAAVADIFGEEALDPGGWPDRFADRDIVMDHNMSVVPGSSRRNNSTIETKLLQDTYALMLQDPTVSPEEIIEIRRRLNESNGIYGIDYEASMQHVLQQKIDEALGAGGGEEQGAGGKPTGPGAGDPTRTSEQSEPSMSGQVQGQNNVGGGRGGRGGVRSQLRKARKESTANA